jgi:hypothetical protein
VLFCREDSKLSAKRSRAVYRSQDLGFNPLG